MAMLWTLMEAYSSLHVTPTSQTCGGAVNPGTCNSTLWMPTGDSSMHCFAYGGPQDPCSLNNNNDANDGLNKNPSACQGDTFYLWDEPDTQGRDYAWAGREWVNYASRFHSEITSMRRRGVKFTSPLLRADNTEANLRSFFLACGAACSDRSSPAYIDVIGVNVFCGPWNMAPGLAPVEGCRAGARYMVGIFQNLPQVRAGLPVYVTNWSRLQVNAAADQLAAMYAIDAFYSSNSPVERVYWFGAIDYGGGSTNNFLTDFVTSGADAGKTLGQVWASTCGSSPEPPSPAPCTEEGGDPYNNPGGEFVACCPPLTPCLRDWNGDGNWFYICRERC